jgi:hypothetical protein
VDCAAAEVFTQFIKMIVTVHVGRLMAAFMTQLKLAAPNSTVVYMVFACVNKKPPKQPSAPNTTLQRHLCKKN